MLNLKKIFAEAKNKEKVKDFTHFEKVVVFEKNDTFRVFRIFRPEGKIC
jgi:hypothetical protein